MVKTRQLREGGRERIVLKDRGFNVPMCGPSVFVHPSGFSIWCNLHMQNTNLK